MTKEVPTAGGPAVVVTSRFQGEPDWATYSYSLSVEYGQQKDLMSTTNQPKDCDPKEDTRGGSHQLITGEASESLPQLIIGEAQTSILGKKWKGS